jgi:hypothetical protein
MQEVVNHMGFCKGRSHLNLHLQKIVVNEVVAAHVQYQARLVNK